jgi:acetyl-CoA acetyltransferase
MSRDVFVYDGVRTLFGKYGGALAGSRPDDLAAFVVRAIVDRAPGLDPAQVDEIVLGNANGAGEDNRNVARMAGLLAGLPVSVPASTVNRLCGSSLDAAFAAQSVACIKAWDIDPAIVNRHGGAIAIGHPLGASGTRILGTLARSLLQSGERWGVAAICIGVGQGLAVVLENARSSS